jgi:hypothetical protein
VGSFILVFASKTNKMSIVVDMNTCVFAPANWNIRIPVLTRSYFIASRSLLKNSIHLHKECFGDVTELDYYVRAFLCVAKT